MRKSRNSGTRQKGNTAMSKAQIENTKLGR